MIKTNPAPLLEVVKKTEASLNTAFVNALQGDNKNDLADFLYSMPINDNDPVQGARYYDLILENCSDYYLYNAEIDMIDAYAKDIASSLPQSVSVIEHGPGPQKTIRRKTLPLLTALQDVKRYVAVDRNYAYAQLAGNYIKFSFPGIKIESIEGDQFDSALNYSYYENPLIIGFGGTLFNIDPANSENLQDNIARHMRIWANQLGQRGYLLIAHDTNQHESSLLKAYSNKWNEDFIRSVLYRVQRDLPLQNWTPNLWTYQVHWNPEKYQLDMGFVANDNQNIVLNGQTIEIKKDQYLHIESSYKLPADRFLEAAQAGGFEPVKTFSQPGNPVALHLLKVVE